MNKKFTTIACLIVCLVSLVIIGTTVDANSLTDWLFGNKNLGATTFPSSQVGQTPQNGYYLKTNGSVSTWSSISAAGGSGTVGTSTSETSGYLPYWTTTSATPALLGKVATNTASCGGNTSCTPFTIIGGSPITISSTGGSISTSSYLTAGLLLQSTAWNTIANIATNTLNINTDNLVQGATNKFMTYPGAGIALSSGSGWSSSITDNSGNWNTAFTNASSSLYNFLVSRGNWTTIDNYPAACGAGSYVTQIGDTLTCSVPPGTGLTTIGSGSVGNLPYWTGANTLSGVATTTLTENSLALSLSNPISVIGGSASVLSLATSSLFTGVTNQLTYFSGTNAISGLTAGSNGNVLITSNSVPSWSATTSPTFGLGLTSGGTWGTLGISPTLSLATTSLFTGATNQLATFSGTNTITGLSNGSTNGLVLALSAGVPTWTATSSSGFSNPMTAPGDIIYGGAAGGATRLASSTYGQYLAINSTGYPVWTATSTLTRLSNLVETGLIANASTTLLSSSGNTFLSTGYNSIVTIGTPTYSNSSSTILEMASSSTGYLQAVLKNTSAGTAASSDLVLENNLGTDTKYFMNMGLNSSAFNNSTWTINGANSGYLYTSDGDLAIGTASSTRLSTINFFTGGTLTANSRFTIQDSGATSTNLTVNTNSWLGTVRGGTWNGGTIGVGYGGTGLTTLTSAGSILYATSPTALTTLASSSYGTVLQIDSNGKPSWVATTSLKITATPIGTISTSTAPTKGQIPYWTSSGAWPETLSSAATTTLTAGLALSLSNPVTIIGGSASSLTIATSSLFTGATSQLAYFTGANAIGGLSNGSTNGLVLALSGGVPTWTATTSLQTPWTNNVNGGNYSLTNVNIASSTQFIAYTGSDSNLSYTFSGDTNTGIYNGGVDTLSFDTNANQRMVITTTNITNLLDVKNNFTRGYYLVNSAGSASAPTYSFYGELNTGLWSSADDTINFSVGGSNGLTIASSSGVMLTTMINATSTAFSSAYASSTTLYAGTSYIPSLGTPAGTFLAADPNGKVIATTTPTSSGSSNTTFYPAFSYATSTSWTGTTTLLLGTAYVGETWNGVQCFTDTGTLNVVINDGTNKMNLLNASTTVGTNILNINNAWTAAEKRYVDVGTPASSPTKISCTVSKALASTVNFYPSFAYATSTTWTGTTTIPLGTAYIAETFDGVQCFTDTGTLNVVYNNGTNNMNNVNASTTVGTNVLNSNNTFSAAGKKSVSIGTPASNPTKVSCTLKKH